MLGKFVKVYVDDILSFSKTKEEHLMHVRMVLETLKHHRLYAKANKCQLAGPLSPSSATRFRSEAWLWTFVK